MVWSDIIPFVFLFFVVVVLYFFAKRWNDSQKQHEEKIKELREVREKKLIKIKK